MIEKDMQIGEKTYRMVLCPECAVWIPKDQYDEIKHPAHSTCANNKRTRPMRERAARNVGRLFDGLLIGGSRIE